ncbi:Ribosomal RNA small subunit methyltransferase A [Morus notabilis]|uniref:rRNA adenine N(6)-methyltransferase n=1 Tax=Morus notabilis TaxID=981085 RepID=W9RWP7_9ROSA|nr:Ribosomal RNA small subunit methyltransferase A [Morus notabilis]
MTSAVHLLQCLPPISSTTTPKQRLKPSKPAHNTTQESRRASSSPCPLQQQVEEEKAQMTTTPLSKLSTLKAVFHENLSARLTPYSHSHYMLNSEINEQLSSAADVGDGDVVLEIGPGTGSLTNVLISAGAYVIAIEKDPHMAALVSERFADTDHLKVVANIPFNISTDVVKQLLPMGDIISEVVLLLQVDAAIVKFKLKRAEDYPSVSSTKSFFSMINSVFNGKRKMLRRLLQHICSSSEIENALRNVGLPPTPRYGPGAALGSPGTAPGQSQYNSRTVPVRPRGGPGTAPRVVLLPFLS